jgi:hypothetical protein
MRIILRHTLIAALPLVFGLAAGWGFAHMQPSCSHLVGFAFAAKCHGVQLEWQVLFQTAGTVAGCVLAAPLGAWLELRGRRAVERARPQPGEVS